MLRTVGTKTEFKCRTLKVNLSMSRNCLINIFQMSNIILSWNMNKWKSLSGGYDESTAGSISTTYLTNSIYQGPLEVNCPSAS